jgi:hypothetical protein
VILPPSLAAGKRSSAILTRILTVGNFEVPQNELLKTEAVYVWQLVKEA